MQSSTVDEETLKQPAVLAGLPKGEISRANTGWWSAIKQVFPIYLATHIAFLAITYLATLFALDNFSQKILPLRTLLQSWVRWDTNLYIGIATHGYQQPVYTAFFPLFPLLERGLAFIVQDTFIAGLIISNIATLGVLVVLYRLVAEDFETEKAWLSVLCLAIFPTAFFFAAAYNESLFLFFALLSFYQMRKGHWWLAGLAALFASLTRASAVALFVPFIYEYLRQRGFNWRKLDIHIFSIVGVIGGVLIMLAYGYFAFNDPLAFSHAEKVWGRELSLPWFSITRALDVIMHNPILYFWSIHNIIDLSACLFILVLIILSFVGPWKFSREKLSYALYGAVVFIFFLVSPETKNLPLASLSRYSGRRLVWFKVTF